MGRTIGDDADENKGGKKSHDGRGDGGNAAPRLCNDKRPRVKQLS